MHDVWKALCQREQLALWEAAKHLHLAQTALWGRNDHAAALVTKALSSLDDTLMRRGGVIDIFGNVP